MEKYKDVDYEAINRGLEELMKHSVYDLLGLSGHPLSKESLVYFEREKVAKEFIDTSGLNRRVNQHLEKNSIGTPSTQLSFEKALEEVVWIEKKLYLKSELTEINIPKGGVKNTYPDSRYHEVVRRDSDDNYPNNVILSVLQVGYKTKEGDVLRKARVVDNQRS